VGTSYNSSPLFVHFMHLNLLFFIVIVIVKVMSFIPSTMETCQGGPFGGALFALAHFRALCSTSSHFLSCLFPSIANNTHIIGPFSIVSCTYEHFQTELRAIGLSIQPHKCIAWSPFGLPPNFNTPSQFTTPSKGIKILGVLLSIVIFTSSFIKETLQEDVQHVDLLPRMGDVQVAFVILTCYFMQHTSYILRCTPPSSTFIESFISFNSSLHKMFKRLFGPGSFDSPKGPLAHK